MNKKGLLGFFVAICLFLIIIVSIILSWYPPSNSVNYCKNIKYLDTDTCINNIKGVKICEKINKRYLKEESNLFVANHYYCYDEETKEVTKI